MKGTKQQVLSFFGRETTSAPLRYGTGCSGRILRIALRSEGALSSRRHGRRKRYGRYVDDFINSHRYIDCNSAVCRNCHEMNIHIIRGLLIDCTSLVKSLFTAETFSFEECMALKRKYDIAGVWFRLFTYRRFQKRSTSLLRL